VGGSAEGAALCYRTICIEGARLLGGHAHPEVSMHTHSLQAYVECIERDDWRGVGQLMLESARRLAGMGADFLICPDNTFHQALRHVDAELPLPFLHIAEVLAHDAARLGYRRVGLAGTRWLVESDVYPRALVAHGIECVLPESEERNGIQRIIMDELVHGMFAPASVEYLQRVIAGFKARGCDAVALACTELPLVLDDASSPLPTLDSTRLLARAAVRRAI
jgi:aspartate racemase